jgi:hypothetical protein
VIYLCPGCKEQIPASYKQNYQTYPPVVGNAIGFTGNGKTIYFAVLFYSLKKLSPAHHWPGFYTLCLNEESLAIVYEHVKMLEEGELPDTTPTTFPRPTIIQAKGIPMQRDCTLLCYDTGGDAFQAPTQLIRHAGFVRQARTAMLFISVPDLENPGTDMHQLLNIYIVGMGELGAHTRDQHLVVVYTKADEMVPYFARRWEDLHTYLLKGSVDGLAHTDGYIKQMYQASTRLWEFTRRELQAVEFLNAADSNFCSVSFSIISALGAKPQGRRLSAEITPRRIFDPLLWMMEKSRPSWRQRWRRWWGA